MNLILVPSADFTPSGLGPATIERCAKAAELWSKGGYDAVIVSGGTRRCWWGSQPESEDMKRWLAGHRIPHNLIFTEEEAVDTYGNLLLTIELLKRCRVNVYRTSITICTDRLHFARFLATAKAVGVNVTNGEVKMKFTLRRRFIEWILLQIAKHDPLGEGTIAERNKKSRSRPHPLAESSPPLG